jgi:hypothetical protein
MRTMRIVGGLLAYLCVLGALMIASFVGIAALLSPSGIDFVGALLSPSGAAGRQPVYAAPTRATTPAEAGDISSAQESDRIGSAVARVRMRAETARLRLKASGHELRRTLGAQRQSPGGGNGGASAYAPIDMRHSSNF